MLDMIEFVKASDNELYSIFYQESHAGCYAAYIRGDRCDSYHNLFQEFSAAFQFPRYFGMNSAAFDECMKDLEWLPVHKIFLLIDRSDYLFSGNQEDQKWLYEELQNIQETWYRKDIKMRIVISL